MCHFTYDHWVLSMDTYIFIDCAQEYIPSLTAYSPSPPYFAISSVYFLGTSKSWQSRNLAVGSCLDI